MNNIKKLLLSLIICVCTLLTAYANDFVFTPINTSNGLSDNQIRYILQLPDGRMVFTTSGNVNLYNGAQFTYLHRSAEHIYPLEEYDGFYHIYSDGDSLLWIKDYHKLMCVNLHREEYIPCLDSYFGDMGIEEPIWDFFMDTNGHMWLQTSAGLFHPRTSRTFDISVNSGILQDLAVEHNKLYLFYNTGEVVCYDIESRERLYVSAAYPASEQHHFQNTSLVVKGKNGFYQLRNGSKGGFFYFNPSTREWTKILEKEYHLNTLIVTPQEKTYISCAYGIWIIDPQANEQQYMPVLKTIDGNIVSTEISTLFYDKQGGLWIGTLNRGLLYYHPSRYKFTYVGTAAFPHLSGEDIAVQQFAEDEAGNIYFNSRSNTYQYTPLATDNKTVKNVPFPSLPSSVQKELQKGSPYHMYEGKHYTALCTDTRGWVWAGTPDGLRLFKPNEQKEQVFYTSDGLPNNFIHDILEDSQQRIWVTTSYGISLVQVNATDEKIYFTNFNSYDGTLKGEYLSGSAFEATDGTLYFGGVDGFNVLRPDSLSAIRLPFKPIFTRLYLRGEEVKAAIPYDNRIILTQAAPYTREIELSYNQNFLTVEFSALNYLNQVNTCYRYLLEGVDSDWHETAVTGQGENINADGLLRVSYTNLPPGKYNLKVMAADSSRQWDVEVTELSIIIHAPWWRTTTAYCIYILLVLIISIGSIYLYMYIVRKRLERQHKEEILLLRIRGLIEQCNQYEEGQRSHSEETNPLITSKELPSECIQETADAEFLVRAMEQVEKNLNAPGYSVEQLSRDLCMDRTGLYRKLITLLDESPSLFIRNIRLRRAAQLILEGELSITEISERVGFSSSSYMSKCFQEMYGCRPSEYNASRKTR